MNKVATLIDGGYFTKRLSRVQPKVNGADPQAVCRSVKRLIAGHPKRINKIERCQHQRALLYRAFYYDARPYLKRGHLPVSKRSIDYAAPPEALFHNELHNALRKTSGMAVRLGEVRPDPAGLWSLKPETLKALLRGARKFGELLDDDFRPTFRQKAVDMRIGLDIASLTLKRQAGTIVLVAGDSDFVPAAKLARREGVKIVLDPLWRSVDTALFEHIDGLDSGFPKPKRVARPEEES